MNNFGELEIGSITDAERVMLENETDCGMAIRTHGCADAPVGESAGKSVDISATSPTDTPLKKLVDNSLEQPLEALLSISETIRNPGINTGEHQDAVALGERLILLTKSLDQRNYQLVTLLPEFDRKKGWSVGGHRSCTSWLNACCGMSPSAANDRRRVAYALEDLPVIRQLFQRGELSWSKVRALTRIATSENERSLVEKALNQSASEIEQSVRQFRDVTTTQAFKDERSQSERQYQRRQVNVYREDDGMVRLYCSLPPLEGNAVLQSMARAEDELFEEVGLEQLDGIEITATQRRADALFRMAMEHMAAKPNEVKLADRYQVVVHVDAATLHQTDLNPDPSCQCRAHKDKQNNKALRSYIESGSAVAASTVRRLTDDCSVLAMLECEGEPLSIGRKTRVWPQSVARAIRYRDQHCQFPGCDASRHLQLHHMVHWVDGGETSVENGVSLCGHHHRLVHERQYTVERTPEVENEQRPVRTLEVTAADGSIVALSAPVRRFRVRRIDGSIVGE